VGNDDTFCWEMIRLKKGTGVAADFCTPRLTRSSIEI